MSLNGDVETTTETLDFVDFEAVVATHVCAAPIVALPHPGGGNKATHDVAAEGAERGDGAVPEEHSLAGIGDDMEELVLVVCGD